MCAASCQGELGEQSEQSSHPLHGQGLQGMSAELCRQCLQGPQEHWVQLSEEDNWLSLCREARGGHKAQFC